MTCTTAADCDAHRFASGAGAAVCSTWPTAGAAGRKYCNQPQWAAMPAGLDFVSTDVYNRGAIEVKVARQHYGHYLLPLLKPHQHVWLVPGLYGKNGTEGNATATQHNDAELVEKLSAHLAWARSDSRIAGFAAWHWGTLPPDFSPRSMTIGGGFYPRTLELVAQIVANASTALKTEDGGVDMEASPAGPSPRLGFLSRTLGDFMVLQSAPATALVWGNTSAHASVTTTFGATTLHTTAGADGIWRQRLPPTAASSKPHSLHFVSSSGESAS